MVSTILWVIVLFWGCICWQSAMSVNNSECQVLSKFCICFYKVMALAVDHKIVHGIRLVFPVFCWTVKLICFRNLPFSLIHQHLLSSLVCFSYAPAVIWSSFLCCMSTSQRDTGPQILNLVFSHCKIFTITCWYGIKVIIFSQNTPNGKCSQVLRTQMTACCIKLINK